MTPKRQLPHVVGSTVAVVIAAVLSVPAALLGGALVESARRDDAASPTASTAASTTSAGARRSDTTVPPTPSTTTTDTTGTTVTASPPATLAAVPSAAAIGLVADFTWAPENPRPGESIRLIDRSSGPVTRWSWRWNRNSVSSSKPNGLSTTVNADTPFTLTVCDAADLCVTTTKTVVVGS
jgi:PKD repeat protein